MLHVQALVPDWEGHMTTLCQSELVPEIMRDEGEGGLGHWDGWTPGRCKPRLTLRIENEDSSGGSRERQERERQILVMLKPWRKPGLRHELSGSVVQRESVHSVVLAGESHNSALPPGCGHEGCWGLGLTGCRASSVVLWGRICIPAPSGRFHRLF